MAYDNINFHPAPRKDGQLTGWARPKLDRAMIREWYGNFEDWQNKLPKTDYSKSPTSIWYTHEWVPGVPVMPNLSRPPIHQSNLSFEKYESVRRRFISTPDLNDSFLLNGNGSIISPVPDRYHNVWYKRIVYTIHTILTTITTTIINTTTGHNEAQTGRIFQNGNTSFTFSDSDEEFLSSKRRERVHQQEAWYTRMIKTIFFSIVRILNTVSYAVVAPFYAMYRMLSNIEALCLLRFNNLFGLNTARRRFWALILLLTVPFLILFGWGYKWDDQKISDVPVDVKDEDDIGYASYGWSSWVTNPVSNYGWSSIVTTPLTTAYGGLLYLFNKPSAPPDDQEPLEVLVPASSVPIVPLPTQKKSDQDKIPSAPLLNAQTQEQKVLEKIVYVEKEVDFDKLLHKEKDKLFTLIVPKIESIVRVLLEKHEHKMTEDLSGKMKLQYDELKAVLDGIKIETDKLLAQQNQHQQMIVDMQATSNKIIDRQTQLDVQWSDQEAQLDARFRKQREEIDSMFAELRTKYDSVLSQKTQNHVTVDSTNIADYKEFIHEIVKMYVNIYDADKLDIPDYALMSSGGSVLSTRCTKSVSIDTAYLWLWFDVPWSKTSNPFNVLQPAIYPGECWCFVGSEGHLVINLSANITVTSVTLEHAHKSLLPPGTFESAPNKFTVFGLESENDVNSTLLGTFSYEDNGKSLQRFQTLPSTRSFKIIELHIQSNHGAEHTCVYRFRVHGIPQFLDED